MSSWQQMLQEAAERRGDFSFGASPYSPRCGICQYWRVRKHGNGAGWTVSECHRHAPQANANQGWAAEYEGPQSWACKLYPTTYYNDWCGDFSARVE